MKVELVSSMGSDLSVVNAARVSFNQESTWEQVPTKLLNGVEWDETITETLSARDRKLVEYLAKHKHTSCFEHQVATLRLKVPIFIARQIQRHRTFSYNEVSRRYVSTEPEFFWPAKWRAKADNVKQGSSEEAIEASSEALAQSRALDSALLAVKTYHELMEDFTVAPELARMILPQNMYTEFYMTGKMLPR